MATRRSCDVLVVGGGPAGTTLATLVKKYAPRRKVLLLEKDAAPSHQVGESLLPGMIPVLKEMGVFEKVDAFGFPKKLGATYIWGRDRKPWENDFNDVNMEAMLARYGGVPPRIEYAWQVRRSEYDEILLRHAEGCGVEVLRGARAAAIRERAGAIVGVRAALAGGGSQEITCGLLADCSGQSGFLSRYRKIREYNPALQNVAAFAYFRGARWKYAYTGHPDKTKIFICTVASGWLWYIPVSRDIVSVGLVTTVEHLKKSRTRDLRGLFESEVRGCREIAPLLSAAEWVKDVEGTGKDFFTHSDWSYLNVAASGPGWLAAGDAAVFVDPILSSGVTLAHLTAHRAAYTALSSWKEGDAAVRKLLWESYDAFCRESAAQFLVLALFWYGNDRHAGRWWGKAAELQRACLPVRLNDKGAFVTLSTGMTQYYDRVFSLESLGDENVTRPADFPFYAMMLRAEGSAAAEVPDIGGVPKVLYPYRLDLTFLPLSESGQLKPLKRLRFLKHDPDDPVKDAFNPRKVVTRYHLDLLEAVDGVRTLDEVFAVAAGAGVPEWWLRRHGRNFLQDLSVQGAVRFEAKSATVPVRP